MVVRNAERRNTFLVELPISKAAALEFGIDVLPLLVKLVDNELRGYFNNEELEWDIVEVFPPSSYKDTPGDLPPTTVWASMLVRLA